MKKDTGDKVSKFWKFVYDMHLYDTKVEGLFKAFLILFSWGGGVHIVEKEQEAAISILASLFLFSIALIMEYTVRLLTADKLATKILPLVIVAMSAAEAFFTFCGLVDRPFDVGIKNLYYATIAPQLIIWLDVISQILIEKPKETNGRVEATLKNMGVVE